MYSSFAGAGYNQMELNKENFSHGHSRTNKNAMFETPTKQRGGFMTFEDAFHTPANAFGDRSQSHFGTPICQTVSRMPNEFGEAPDVQVVYFEDLRPLDSNAQTTDIMAKIKYSFSKKGLVNWVEKLESINTLRRLNKFYSDEIHEIFVQFGDEIIHCFQLVNVHIQRSILLFIAEVLNINKTKKSLDQRIIQRLIPFLLNRSLSSNAHLREISKFSLEAITKELACDTSLIAFCEHSLGKNPKQNDLSFRMLGYSIQNLGEAIKDISSDSLRAIFVVFSKYIHRDAGRITSLCVSGAKYMCGKMGEANYINLLRDLVDNNLVTVSEAESMVEAVREQSGKPQGPQKYQAIRSEIRQMKQKYCYLSKLEGETLILTDKKTRLYEMGTESRPYNGASLAGSWGGMSNQQQRFH